LLGHEKEFTRLAAVKALGNLGDARAVEPLINLLGHENECTRLAAVKALGNLGDARAMKPLIQALGDANKEIVESAVNALRTYTCAVGPLIKTLADAGLMSQWAAAKVLGTLGDARAVAPLIEVLDKGDLPARQAAAEALGSLGDARAIAPLIKALGDDSKVRDAAAKALHQLGEPTWRSLIKDYGYNRLVEFPDARIVEPLIKLLDRDEDSVYWGRAAEALGHLGNLRAVEPLIKVLGNVDCPYQAAKALGTLGDARAVTPLIMALDHKEKVVRKCAVEALGSLGDTRAINPLISAALNDGSIQSLAVQTLDRMGWRPANAQQRALHAVATEQWDAAVEEGTAAMEPLLAAFLKDMRSINSYRASTGNLESDAIANALARIRFHRLRPFIDLLADNTKQAPAAVSILMVWLDPCDPNISDEDLCAIIELQEVKTPYLENVEIGREADSYNTPIYSSYLAYSVVDIDRLQQLAKQELIRRGSDAKLASQQIVE